VAADVAAVGAAAGLLSAVAQRRQLAPPLEHKIRELQTCRPLILTMGDPAAAARTSMPFLVSRVTARLFLYLLTPSMDSMTLESLKPPMSGQDSWVLHDVA